MKKMLLILFLLFIPLHVRADEVDDFLSNAESVNTEFKKYMQNLNEICKNGTAEECSAHADRYSSVGGDIRDILNQAESYGVANDPIIKNMQANYDIYLKSATGGFGEPWSFDLYSSCKDIYGGELGDWINNVFTFVKYAGLALVVILTTMDFLKVVTSEKDDSLSNAFNRFVKRCIAVILLFLTPVLINFVFDLLGDNIKGSDGTVIDVCIDFINK